MKLVLTIAVCLTPFLSQAASAQGLFGRVLRDVGRTATQSTLRSTPTAPAPAADPVRAAPKPSGSAPAARVAPFPIGHQYPEQNDPRDLRFSQADKDAVKRFVDQSEVACTDCEGLKTYEAWARHQLNMTRTGVFEARVGALNVGQALNWRGRASGTAYAITVTSAEPVGQFRCKQVKWTATKASERRERLGLFCWWPRNERWEEVL